VRRSSSQNGKSTGRSQSAAVSMASAATAAIARPRAPELKARRPLPRGGRSRGAASPGAPRRVRRSRARSTSGICA
jgi:hypothetical protein